MKNTTKKSAKKTTKATTKGTAAPVIITGDIPSAEGRVDLWKSQKAWNFAISLARTHFAGCQTPCELAAGLRFDASTAEVADALERAGIGGADPLARIATSIAIAERAKAIHL